MSTALRAALRWLDLREQAAPFARAREGATAVEFALVALPFFALVGACLENGIVFWEQEILQQAVSDASRQIYTGAFQTTNAGTTNTATLMSRFRTAICTQPNGTPRVTIFTCANVRVSVTKVADYGSAIPISPGDCQEFRVRAAG